MISRAVAVAAKALGVVVLVAACGGKVDGGSDPTATRVTGTGAGGHPGGTGPKRPQPTPATSASVGSQVAEAYCKAFSSCCVGAGQPPIDVSRCRDLTSAAVEAKVDASVDQLMPGIVDVCVEAIRARTAACGKTDVAWWGSDQLALFAPSSIQSACGPLIGKTTSTGAAECSAGKPCPDGRTCAIDECSNDEPAGGACFDEVCLDGLVCTASTCGASRNLGVDAACDKDEDCQLGLVCFMGACAAARDHADVYKERSSPYRVGADTCKAFTFL